MAGRTSDLQRMERPLQKLLPRPVYLHLCNTGVQLFEVAVKHSSVFIITPKAEATGAMDQFKVIIDQICVSVIPPRAMYYVIAKV